VEGPLSSPSAASNRDVSEFASVRLIDRRVLRRCADQLCCGNLVNEHQVSTSRWSEAHLRTKKIAVKLFLLLSINQLMRLASLAAPLGAPSQPTSARTFQRPPGVTSET
jgi:hypothetical protein